MQETQLSLRLRTQPYQFCFQADSQSCNYSQEPSCLIYFLIIPAWITFDDFMSLSECVQPVVDGWIWVLGRSPSVPTPLRTFLRCAAVRRFIMDSIWTPETVFITIFMLSYLEKMGTRQVLVDADILRHVWRQACIFHRTGSRWLSRWHKWHRDNVHPLRALPLVNHLQVILMMPKSMFHV